MCRGSPMSALIIDVQSYLSPDPATTSHTSLTSLRFLMGVSPKRRSAAGVRRYNDTPCKQKDAQEDQRAPPPLPDTPCGFRLSAHRHSCVLATRPPVNGSIRTAYRKEFEPRTPDPSKG